MEAKVLVKFQAWACNFTKNRIPIREVFITFLKTLQSCKEKKNQQQETGPLHTRNMAAHQNY